MALLNKVLRYQLVILKQVTTQVQGSMVQGSMVQDMKIERFEDIEG